MRVAVVPAKGFDASKQRLATVLPPLGRAALARAMLEDVLAALEGAGFDRVLVVTPDGEVAELAGRLGALVVREPEAGGHTAAVHRGVAAAVALGASAVLTVPADVPATTTEELRAVVAAAGPAPCVVLVASRNGQGTNAAFLSPPDVIPLRFGEPSFPAHVAAARARGIEPVVLDLPGLALDLDAPEDLAALRRQGRPTRALAALRGCEPVVPPGVPRLEIVGLTGLPEVTPGADLGLLLVQAVEAQGTELRTGDLVVVSQKAVSKAEGRLVRLDEVRPSPFAVEVGRAMKKDPRVVELILRESRRIVRMDRGLILAETHQGHVCANAGVDQSNVPPGWVSLLPSDPDGSARRLADRLRELAGVEVPVIVADTFGRPWREGLQNVAVGIAGLRPLRSYLGLSDTHGYTLQATVLAVADELAAAAELVMGKVDGVPAALIRGYPYEPGPGSARELVRDPARDLFR